MSKKIKSALRLLLFLGIGATILVLVFRNQNTAFQEQCRLDGVPESECSLFQKLMTDFSSVNPMWMSLVMIAFTLSNMFRAWRWQILLKPMGYQVRFANSLLTILLGYFANLGLPRMGEVVRAGSLARYERLPVERVMGTLVVDRLMDFICLGIVVGLAFLFEADTLLAFIQKSQGDAASGGLLQNPWVIALLVLMAAGAGMAFVFRKKLFQLPVFKKISQLIEGFWIGLRSVFRLEKTGLFFLLSLGIWLMFYLQCWFNLKAFAPTAHLSAGAALMIFVFGTLGFIIPSPGGMGTFHALAMAGLALYGINSVDGFSYANIAFFAVQIFYNIIAGLLSLLLLPALNKQRQAGVTNSDQ